MPTESQATLADQPAAPNRIGALRRSRRARLRTLTQADLDLLYQVEMSEELSVRWRFRGSTPSPFEYAPLPWKNMLATFIIENRNNGAAVGLVALHNANMVSGRASFSLTAFPGYERTPAVLDGALLAIDYAFTVWPFRKLYAEVPEFNLDQMASVSRHLFTEEARMLEWDYFDGRWWDLIHFSLHRRKWDERRAELLGRILE